MWSGESLPRLHGRETDKDERRAFLMAVYLSAVAIEQLATAQAVVDRHVATDAAGRCSGCGQMPPCDSLCAAERVFAAYGQLPVRRPGLTLPAAQDRFGWLDPK